MPATNITKPSGGSGAGADFDGTDAVQTHMTNPASLIQEVLEWRFRTVELWHSP